MNLYDYTVRTREGSPLSLETYRGRVLLIVNTATGCGFTPQYEALEALYEKYHARGFEVLDFPCNQFGGQAPGDDAEIHEFCTLRYHTQFDQLAKIDVNGDAEEPLYAFLKQAQPEEAVEGLKNKAIMAMVSKLSSSRRKPSDIVWNFTKFLVDRDGNVVGRFPPTTDPAALEARIEALL